MNQNLGINDSLVLCHKCSLPFSPSDINKDLSFRRKEDTDQEDDEDVSDNQTFVVEKVLKHWHPKRNTSAMQFLVKWKGYGTEQNTWEPLVNLVSVGKLHDYLALHDMKHLIAKDFLYQNFQTQEDDDASNPCYNPQQTELPNKIPSSQLNSFKCTARGCTKSYKYEGSLVHHMKAIHGEKHETATVINMRSTKPNSFKCTARGCTKSYKYEGSLVHHMKAIHGEKHETAIINRSVLIRRVRRLLNSESTSSVGGSEQYGEQPLLLPDGIAQKTKKRRAMQPPRPPAPGPAACGNSKPEATEASLLPRWEEDCSSDSEVGGYEWSDDDDCSPARKAPIAAQPVRVSIPPVLPAPTPLLPTSASVRGPTASASIVTPIAPIAPIASIAPKPCSSRW
jgi:hypothetical protein